MKKQILVNVGSNYLLSFFGMALGFLLVPFLIRHLGAGAYGLTVLAEATVAFFEVLTISVRVALSRHATYALSKDDIDSFIEYLSTGRVILYFSSAVVILLGAFVSVNFAHFFQVPPHMALDSEILFFLVCLGFTISIPNTIFWSVLYARNRFDLINFSMSIGLVFRAVAIFFYYLWAPKAWQTLAAYGMIFLAMTFTQNYLIYFWHKRVMPEGRQLGSKYFKKDRVKEILSFSFHTSLTRASSLLYQETSQIIINVFWGPVFNTIYSIAIKFPNMMRRIFIEPSWALTSTFTDLAARGEKGRVEQLLYMYSKALSILTFPPCIVLILFAGPLVSSWVGPDFAMAGQLLPLFSVSLFVSIPFSLTGCITNAYGKVKVPSFVSIISAVANVALCLLLGVGFSFKLFGIAYAGLICSTAVFSLFQPIYCCRVSGLSVSRYWIESFIKPFVLVCIFIGGGFYLLGLSEYKVFLDIRLLLTLAGLTTAYYLAAYLFILSPEEKKHIHEIVQRRRSRT